MTTLHDLLKRDEADDRAPQAPRVDLSGRYSPIGLSAVERMGQPPSSSNFCGRSQW